MRLIVKILYHIVIDKITTSLYFWYKLIVGTDFEDKKIEEVKKVKEVTEEQKKLDRKKLKDDRNKAFKDAKTKEDVIKLWENYGKCNHVPKSARKLFCKNCRDDWKNKKNKHFFECPYLKNSKIKERSFFLKEGEYPTKVITLSCSNYWF